MFVRPTAPVHERRRASAQAAVNHATDRPFEIHRGPRVPDAERTRAPNACWRRRRLTVACRGHARAAPSRATGCYTAARISTRQTRRSRDRWRDDEPAKRRDGDRRLAPRRRGLARPSQRALAWTLFGWPNENWVKRSLPGRRAAPLFERARCLDARRPHDRTTPKTAADAVLRRDCCRARDRDARDRPGGPTYPSRAKQPDTAMNTKKPQEPRRRRI